MKRAEALAHMRFAGYHEDRARFTRLFIEHRVAKPVADAEFNKGRAMKEAGVPCGCPDCKTANDAASPDAALPGADQALTPGVDDVSLNLLQILTRGVDLTPKQQTSFVCVFGKGCNQGMQARLTELAAAPVSDWAVWSAYRKIVWDPDRGFEFFAGQEHRSEMAAMRKLLGRAYG